MTSSATPGEAALPREPYFGTAFDAAPRPSAAPAASADASIHHLPIRFTGSGSEYFRIWIVNLLLTLVTLGIYYPWAKVRRLRYFYGNTLVGEHPLDFHGDPKKMLRGYLLVGAMFVLYGLTSQFSPVAGMVSFLAIAALWPALFKAGMQFRMANTSWRGLRFRFKGTVGGAYAALLPLFVPALLIVAVALQAPPEGTKPPGWFIACVLAVPLVVVLIVPWLLWRLKKYQHDHYALAQWQTELRTGPGSFYVVFLKTIGVSLLAMVVFAGVIFVGAMVFGTAAFLTGGADGEAGVGTVIAIVAGVIVAVLGMLLVQMLPRPYATSRIQNLLWTRTGNRSLRFRSELKFVPLLGLTLKNWLLMVLTLGLYWPFAAVALARIRLEAVRLETRTDPATLFDQARPADGDAAGDAAGDLLDFDIGL